MERRRGLPDSEEQETKLPTLEVGMSDLDDFLATTLARQVQAEEALHNGDPEPRLAMWSTQDPVTVLGALRSASGWDQVSRLFRWLGSGFSDCTSYRFELLAAGVSGDLAYTVGHEHTSVSWDGTPLDPYTLRVTHAYRREDGEWRIVHRHADAPPIHQTSPAGVSTE
jgi:ketosteroid isomerase-like protein